MTEEQALVQPLQAVAAASTITLFGLMVNL